MVFVQLQQHGRVKGTITNPELTVPGDPGCILYDQEGPTVLLRPDWLYRRNKKS